jgi:hypothetical protein
MTLLVVVVMIIVTVIGSVDIALVIATGNV